MDKLYLIPNFSPVDVSDVIDKLFRDKHTKQPRANANATYYDEECMKTQCIANWRSFEDMLALARGYFPKTTEIELMEVLIKLKLSFIYCHNIHKLVFIRWGGSPITKTEFADCKRRKYCKGTYTANNLIKLLKQKNETFISRLWDTPKRLSQRLSVKR